MPVNKTACPVADWGKPFTPSVASIDSNVASSPSKGADVSTRFCPPSREFKVGIFAWTKGFLSALFSPKPIPSKNKNRTFMFTCLLVSPFTYLPHNIHTAGRFFLSKLSLRESRVKFWDAIKSKSAGINPGALGRGSVLKNPYTSQNPLGARIRFN